MFNIKNITTIMLAILASMTFGIASANAGVEVIDATRVVTPVTVTTETQWKKEVSTYEKTTQKVVVVWYSTKLMSTKGRKCYDVGKGTKYKWFWNSYKRVSNGKQVWFKDTRRSELCGTGSGAKQGKNLKRTACQNPSRLPTQAAPPKAKRVKHVSEFKKVSEVKKFFTETGTSTSKTTTTTVTYTCPEGFTPIENGMKCQRVTKDSTQTPPPPATAPGMNPAPSPQDPVGSNQCYEEGTNNPVPPRTDGLCPAGSYGA